MALGSEFCVGIGGIAHLCGDFASNASDSFG